MKFTKKILSAVLSAALALTLCACSGGASPQTSGTTLPATSGQASAFTGAPGESAQASPDVTAAAATADTDKIDNILAAMSLEEKVGQMFFIRCPDLYAADWVETYHLGGYVLFGKDFEGKTADEVRADVQRYQDNAKIPLLIGVDEEGGTVVRASDNPYLRDSAFPSPKNVYLNGGWDAVDSTEREKAELLLSLGVNVNMAPVCDITSNTESFIFDRSFSGNADEVCTFVKKVVGICNEKKLGTVLKHFPGYGDNTDTHEDMSYDAKPYEDFQNTDFLPFQAGIDAGADSIMVAHNIVASMDEENPASLSTKVHQIIREELHFDGVIMTDDLIMSAISKYTGADASAVAAAKCGNDILCCTDIEAQYPAVLAAAQNGEISEEQINVSVRRILMWKQKLGLI